MSPRRIGRLAQLARRRHPAAWVTTTYFAEGFPYSVVHVVAETLFAELGASLKAIGLTALLHLPWNLKFLWAPLLDSHGTKRTWLVGTQVAILVALLVLMVAIAGDPAGLAIPTLVFATLAVIAATHDIAIDGFYLEALDVRAQSRWVALRAPAYRGALLLVGGPGLVFAAIAGWPVAFGASAALFLVLALYHQYALPRVETPGRPLASLLGPRAGLGLVGFGAAGVGLAYLSRPGPGAAVRTFMEARAGWAVRIYDTLGLSGVIVCLLGLTLLAGVGAAPTLRRRLDRAEHPYADAFVSFLAKPRVGLILAFVAFFRTGESFLEKMRFPFFKGLGMELADYGTARTFGLLAALAGPALGGWLISRDGLKRWIWPFVLAQNGLNLTYWWLASLEAPDTFLMSAVITLEMFGAGLGTAVFMVYLMRCPLPGHKAAHFAILTALMSVSFTLAGVVSGFLAEAVGFARYFLLTVLASVPAMALIPFLPHLDEPAPPPKRPRPAPRGYWLAARRKARAAGRRRRSQRPSSRGRGPR